MKTENSLDYPYSLPRVLRYRPIAVLTVAISYVLLAKISFLTTIDPGTVSPIFLPAGLALASILILGRKALIGIAIGSFYSNTLLGADLTNLNKTLSFSIISTGFYIAIGSTIASMTAAVILKRLCKREHLLNKGLNVLCLLILGPVIFCTITSLIGVASFYLNGSILAQQFWYTYKTWWLGDAIGIILVTPLILSWALKNAFAKKKFNFLELILYGLITILFCLGIFFQYTELKYLILPLLFWSAYRFPVQITTLVIIIISFFAIVTTTQGIGPFNEEHINDSILFLDLFLSTIGICSLFLSGIITERKKDEKALKKSEEKYRNIFENIQDVIFQTDINGLFMDLSPSVKDFCGYTAEELIGKPMNFLQPDDEKSNIVIKLVNEQSVLNYYERLIKTKSGELKHISLSAKMIFDNDGNKLHINAIARDITQRKENEKEIAFQNQKLQIQNKELEQFAYITSHDLQEPLITLKFFSELLKTEFPKEINEDIKQYLDFILGASDRMQKLIKGLLDYSRIGNQIELYEIDCNEAVNEAITSLSDKIREANCKITTENLPKLNGYFVEFIQLFQHLISNSIKFRKNDIPLIIKINAKQIQNNWHFTFEDNGIGIEEQNKEKAFVIFKRLHNRDDYQGIGIGLAICKKIIDVHEGNIWIESTFGSGTTIHFTIPKKRQN